MKTYVHLFGGLFLALIAVSSAHGVTKIVLVGDSTVESYNSARPFRGWGQMLQAWAKPGVVVHNEAVSGTSSKSFRDLGLWSKAMKDKPAYVFIQFGHNDIGPDPAHHTDPQTTYRRNLELYIEEARGLGATPILVTPPVRRVYREGKLVQERLLPYVEEMKRVGAEKQVPVLPLYDDSFAYFEALSQEEAQKQVAPIEGDPVHFNDAGASLLAADVLRELSRVAPDVAALFSPPSTVQLIDAK